MDPEALKKHPAVTALADAPEIFAQLTDEQRAIPLVADLISRVEYLNWIFEQTDPSLVLRSELDGLAQLAQQLRAHINSLPSNPEAQANSTEGAINGYFSRFPYPRFKKIPRAESQKIIDDVQAQAAERIAQIKDAADGAIRDFEDFKSILHDELEKLDEIVRKSSDIENKYSSIKEDIGNIIERTTANLESRIEERLSDANSRLGKAIDEFQNSSSEHRSQAKAQLSEIGAERKAAIEESRRAANSYLSEIKTEGKEYIGKIREIYGIAGGDASSGQLIKSANSEASAYRLLGFLAFIAFSTGSLFAYTAIKPALADGAGWQEVASRVGLVVASYIPAWFLASLAMKHRRAEISFRSLAVRVATFDPYLSEFAAEDRTAIKKQMAEIFFSGDLQSERIRDIRIKDLKDIERLISPLESLIDRFRTILTRTGDH